ncbi:hypothetical protein ABN034_33405 [Actinopolymorpha sp. B11F2]|uniref:hypothetical protein n=1 Tax=Actinopolymorpha sp. B11F2 TaxID=3160862 RepID=UPI0032E52D77
MDLDAQGARDLADQLNIANTLHGPRPPGMARHIDPPARQVDDHSALPAGEVEPGTNPVDDSS